MIRVVKGDITTQAVDCIVNAANETLTGGGGVDGAIHRAAGPELLAFTKTLGGCKTGKAVISPAFNLNSKYIIHTVGPVWQGGFNNEASLLKSCYYESLLLAEQNNIKSIAFPSISTGVYRYPFDEAAANAIFSVDKYISESAYQFEEIRFVCFDTENLVLYESFLQKLPTALHIKVTGKVQGVYYRANTLQKAEELELTGTVQNMSDGSVKIIAEGNRVLLQQLIDWCRKGPSNAQVENVTYQEIPIQGFDEFQILKD
jgi:O-acetyl-ADP-ribose deacetylase (regulator of RNase III)/acylphosphatase